MKKLFSSESVTEGHPDKVADQVSDAILDAYLGQDPESRVACETMVKRRVSLAGEITSKGVVDREKVVRDTLKLIGYDARTGFDYDTVAVILEELSEQSPDISRGVTASESKEQGAGDQGMMFGLAINHTPELMPLPISLAHKLTRRLADLRKTGTLDYLLPDGKSQVTVIYEDNKAVGLENVILAAHHTAYVSTEKLRADLMDYVVNPICRELLLPETKVFINATGWFEVGGPVADAGVTGRKIMVDTYGGWARHGGGAFSGKDPSKVDRSGAYAARYIAKNIVAAGLADGCEIQLGYCIGVAQPVSIRCDLVNPHVDKAKLSRMIYELFPVKPTDIIRHFDLKNPGRLQYCGTTNTLQPGWCYRDTAAYGHFGRVKFPWEQTDKVEELKGYF